MNRYTVGKITPIQKREVRASDFGPRASFWMNFPKEGSQLTPPHQSEDFKWKDYCPMVFRLVVDFFNLLRWILCAADLFCTMHLYGILVMINPSVCRALILQLRTYQVNIIFFTCRYIYVSENFVIAVFLLLVMIKLYCMFIPCRCSTHDEHNKHLKKYLL